MTPSPLLALGVTLRAPNDGDPNDGDPNGGDPNRGDHQRAQQEQVARLAGRLGFATVWLPLRPGEPWPDGRRLAVLAAAAQPARLGLVVEQLPPGPAPDGVLLELPPEVRRHSVTGWRDRVHTQAYDADAAGVAVRSADRAVVLDVLRDHAVRREREGAGPSTLTAVVPVSIGRTRNEAVARAARDPELTGPQDPERAGLFGTLEEAQRQVLELAAAGAEALRVIVADERDVADLLAQVHSLVVGPTPLLHARSGTITT
jgi:hypothetical protein